MAYESTCNIREGTLSRYRTDCCKSESITLYIRDNKRATDTKFFFFSRGGRGGGGCYNTFIGASEGHSKARYVNSESVWKIKVGDYEDKSLEVMSARMV